MFLLLLLGCQTSIQFDFLAVMVVFVFKLVFILLVVEGSEDGGTYASILAVTLGSSAYFLTSLALTGLLQHRLLKFIFKQDTNSCSSFSSAAPSLLGLLLRLHKPNEMGSLSVKRFCF